MTISAPLCTMLSMKLYWQINHLRKRMKQFQLQASAVNQEICLYGICLFLKRTVMIYLLSFVPEHMVIQWQIIITGFQGRPWYLLRMGNQCL
uniref:LysA protein n=1 Tax=Bacillus methanolicus TaxID=1471 RepID=Q45316_BACMT|nr:GTG start codon [Bacillus methanolicus MGA3]